ncbi:uncharacterized protein [Nicotiana tomentosiformis]|uniref:uncharacterized protein n=1 Tax=Nicotiana tomentosiformis TaxID=4098 RepID=UPI00388C396F
MGIVETSGAALTTFQLSRAAYQWWWDYEEGSPADATSLTWTLFSEMFLREFVPQTFRDAWCTEFEYICQGIMTVLEYAIIFSELSRHAPTLVSIVGERVRRFIEGLNYGIRFSLARELEIDTPYQQVVDISQRLEGLRGRKREDRKVKRPRDFGGYSGSHAPATSRHGRCYVIRPIHSELPASSTCPAIPRSQIAHFDQPYIVHLLHGVTSAVSLAD